MLLPPLSLYIHIPWCLQKCPYCDFNSHRLKEQLPEREYIAALLADLDSDLIYFKLNEQKRLLHSIFIGGGTPSLISSEGISYLLEQIKQRLTFKDNIEITLEANPGTIESAKFMAYKKTGITRISIGVQSFSSSQLTNLGRIHNKEQVLRTIATAKQIQLHSFNIDLMHGLPNQSIAQALDDLSYAINLEPPHISWYQLTIEPNTLFYSDPPKLPNEDQLWNIFKQGDRLLKNAGYEQYEISGYAKAGFKCEHNLNYWRFGDYLGIGCGAHGKLSFNDGKIIRTTKIKHPRGYLATHIKQKTNLVASNKKEFLINCKPIAMADRPFEFFMNRFRLLEPCPKQDFVDTTKIALDYIQNEINLALEHGYIIEDSKHWRITTKGKYFLNNLLEIFLSS